jgi:hypothetical protein
MKNLTMAQFKMAFGFLLLLCIFVLAVLIARGDVREATSFGLPFILGALSNMSGGWSNWAFGESRTSQGKPEE